MIYEGFEFGSQEALIGGFYAGRAHETKNTRYVNGSGPKNHRHLLVCAFNTEPTFFMLI